MKNKYVVCVLYVILFVAFWNLLDFLYSTFLTHSGYQLAAGTDLLIPLAAALVTGYLFFLREK